MKVALRDNSFRAPVREYPIEWVFRQARAMGYQGIEINLMPDRPRNGVRNLRGLWAEHLDEDARAAIRASAEAQGIEILSLATGWAWNYSQLHPTFDTWQRGVEILKGDCKLAADLGAKVILVHFGTSQGTWDQAKSILSEGAEAAEEAGIALGFESNIWESRYGFGGLDALMEMVAQVDSEGFGVYLHNAFPRAGRPAEEEIQTIGDKLVCIHSSPINTETTDYQAVFSALKQVGYDWYWVFEVADTLLADSRLAWDELTAKYGL
jgi:sugar phosphate isomerase/epimerase